MDQIGGAIEKSHFHHTNLYHSANGGYGLPLAVHTAKLLTCEQESACGKCRNCTRVEKLEHPDVIWSFPTVSGGSTGTCDDYFQEFKSALLANPYLDMESWQETIATKNQQLLFGVKEISNIHKKLSLTSAEGGNRVLIIWLPEIIAAAASNKLLKLIEEPLKNTYILLVSHKPAKLLPTVRSRCAPWKLNPPILEDVRALFPEHGEEDVQRFFLLHPNNIGRVLHNLNEGGENLDLFAHWMRIAYKGVLGEMVEETNTLSALPKEQLKSIITLAIRMLQSGFLVNATGEKSPYSGNLGAIDIGKLSKSVTPVGAMKISEYLHDLLRDLSRNIHTKTAVLNTTIQLNNAFRGRI